MANQEREPAEIWTAALSDAETQIDELYADVLEAAHGCATDDADAAQRMVAFSEKAKALRAELAQLLKGA